MSLKLLSKTSSILSKFKADPKNEKRSSKFDLDSDSDFGEGMNSEMEESDDQELAATGRGKLQAEDVDSEIEFSDDSAGLTPVKYARATPANSDADAEREALFAAMLASASATGDSGSLEIKIAEGPNVEPPRSVRETNIEDMNFEDSSVVFSEDDEKMPQQTMNVFDGKKNPPTTSIPSMESSIEFELTNSPQPRAAPKSVEKKQQSSKRVVVPETATLGKGAAQSPPETGRSIGLQAGTAGSAHAERPQLQSSPLMQLIANENSQQGAQTGEQLPEPLPILEDPERVGKLEAMVQGFVKQKHVTCMALKGLRTSIALDKDRIRYLKQKLAAKENGGSSCINSKTDASEWTIAKSLFLVSQARDADSGVGGKTLMAESGGQGGLPVGLPRSVTKHLAIDKKIYNAALEASRTELEDMRRESRESSAALRQKQAETDGMLAMLSSSLKTEQQRACQAEAHLQEAQLLVRRERLQGAQLRANVRESRALVEAMLKAPIKGPGQQEDKGQQEEDSPEPSLPINTAARSSENSVQKSKALEKRVRALELLLKSKSIVDLTLEEASEPQPFIQSASPAAAPILPLKAYANRSRHPFLDIYYRPTAHVSSPAVSDPCGLKKSKESSGLQPRGAAELRSPPSTGFWSVYQSYTSRREELFENRWFDTMRLTEAALQRPFPPKPSTFYRRRRLQEMQSAAPKPKKHIKPPASRSAKVSLASSSKSMPAAVKSPKAAVLNAKSEGGKQSPEPPAAPGVLAASAVFRQLRSPVAPASLPDSPEESSASDGSGSGSGGDSPVLLERGHGGTAGMSRNSQHDTRSRDPDTSGSTSSDGFV